MTECCDLVGGRDSSATPLRPAQANSNGAKTSPQFGKSAQEAPALQDWGCIFFFAAFIAQVNSENFWSITYSHLHFSTVYSKFCICILCMSFRTSNTWVLYCWSLPFTCPPTLPTVITSYFCHFSAVTLSSLSAKCCKIAGTVAY